MNDSFTSLLNSLLSLTLLLRLVRNTSAPIKISTSGSTPASVRLPSRRALGWELIVDIE